jgi:prefoldin alpha subunit
VTQGAQEPSGPDSQPANVRDAKTGAPIDDATAKKLYERMVELQERSRELDEHLRGVQEQLRALEESRAAIQELERLPQAQETWIPVAPGAYVKGTIAPAASVLLSVGANVAVEKSPAAVLETLTGHEHTLEDIGDKVITELKDVLAELDTLRELVTTNENAASSTPPQ